MTPVTSDVGAPNHEALRRLVAELERYAGWLGKDALSARVRTSVRGLVRAVANGDDPLNTLRIVQAHVNRLGPGWITPLLRQTIRNLRAKLGPVSL